MIFEGSASPIRERLIGAGTWIDGAKGYGRMRSLARIGDTLYACGNGGQIYVRQLVLPSSVNPGELFELDPVASELRPFTPALPTLRGEHIFYAGAVGDVLWVVGQKDIFRFDGSAWARIEHPKV